MQEINIKLTVGQARTIRRILRDTATFMKNVGLLGTTQYESVINVMAKIDDELLKQ